MSLEKLISKYIDGELSNNDDSRLRQIISSDESARRRFDEAVEVHMAVREDAKSIHVPDELLKSTEDDILMNILAEAPASKRESIKLHSWRRQLLAAAVFIFAFTFVYDIYDSQIFNNFNSITNVSDGGRIETNNIADTPIAAENDIDKPVISKAINNTNSTNIINTSKENNSPIIPDISNALISDNSSLLPAIDNENIIAENSLNTIDYIDEITTEVSNIRPSRRNKIISANQAYNTGLMDINFAPAAITNNDVEMTTFAGTDFFQGGIDSKSNKPVTNFSQSIAYHVDEKSRIGLEFGFSEFSYDVTVNLNTNQTNSKNNTGASTEVLNPVGSGDYPDLNIPIIIQRDERMYWGAAFYEYNILENEYFSLISRLGLGTTSSGYVGYGRILGKYNVYKGIAVTVGVDGRLFNANLKNLDRSQGDLKQTASVVYGLQFKF